MDSKHPDPGPGLVLLGGGESHSLSGCDRIVYDTVTGKMLTQGEKRRRYPRRSPFRIPRRETLNAIDPGVLLEAADNYRRMTERG